MRAFQARIGKRSGAKWQAVAESEKGRRVARLTFPGMNDKAVILLTARHHACEAMASYVLEGAVDEFVRLREHGNPIAEVAELNAFPMIDVDGVFEGDQGKGRTPWDHGRDYGESPRYRSVLALRALFRNDDRPLYAL